MNQKFSVIDGGEVNTARLETLTDGIFAIAMTLLVLELHPPLNVLSPADFYNQVLGQWPSLLGFGLSFIILGMFWVAHQTEFKFIKKLDNTLIWLNIFYLLFVSLLPFSTALLGQYYFLQLAVVIYGLHLIVMVLLQYWTWHHSYNHAALVKEDIPQGLDRLSKRLCYLAVTAYMIALLISFVSLPITLIIYAIVPLPYIFGWIYKI
jgi:uncharacterized membrane protein